MKRKIKIITMVMLGILLAIVVTRILYFNSSTSFSNMNSANNPGTETKQLSSLEIIGYNGTTLDSFGNMPENAIKGIQYINIGDYTLKI